MYHQGQLKGEKIKIPVQLRQKQNELPDIKIQHVYERILEFTNQDIIHRGQWSLLRTSTKNILAWQWYIPDSDKLSVVVVNYSSIRSQGRVFLKNSNEIKVIEQLQLNDILNGKTYIKRMEDVIHSGLYVDLQPFQSHLFNIKPI